MHGQDPRRGREAEEEGSSYPEWHAFADDDHYSTGILRFVDKYTLQWDLITSGDNRVLDTITLRK